MFFHHSLCKPFGLRKCELTCGRNTGNMLANESDQMAVHKGSLCKFIEGDLAPEMAAAEQWLPRYETFARHLLDEYQYGSSNFGISVHSDNRPGCLFASSQMKSQIRSTFFGIFCMLIWFVLLEVYLNERRVKYLNAVR